MIKSYPFILLALFSLGLGPNAKSQTYDSKISSSTNFVQDEGEAHIAINPNDSNKMIMGFMSLGTNLSFEIYTTQDAGDSWQQSNFQPEPAMQPDLGSFSLIGGGDIIFAYDVNGDIYCSWITLWCDLTSGSPLDTCPWKSTWAKSTDDGLNFTMQNGSDKHFAEGWVNLNGNLSVYDSLDGIADRQWMAVDFSNGPHRNELFVGYINYPSDITQTGLKVKVKDPNSNSFSSESTAYSGNGQLTNIAIDQNGVLHYTFVDLISNEILHVSSNDGGQSYSTTHLVANGQNVFPQSNQKINGRENSAPSLAIDGNDNLHLVWGDFPSNSTLPTAYYSFSTDAGVTWSTPVDLQSIFNSSVFMPVVSAYENKVTIAGNIVDSNKVSTYMLASSDDNGLSFNPAIAMSSASTDFSSVGTQNFVGDYSSSVRTYCNIYTLWTDCRSNGCKQYIAKYNECANIGLVELTPIESNFTVNKIYPNPVADNLNIEINNSLSSILEIGVLNSAGQPVLNKALNTNRGSNSTLIDVSSLPSGYYFLKVADNDSGVFTTKVFMKK